MFKKYSTGKSKKFKKTKTLTIYIYAVNLYKGGETIYVRNLINVLTKISFINKLIVLFSPTDKDIMKNECENDRVIYKEFYPFLKRFNNSLLERVKKIIIFCGQISGLLKLFMKVKKRGSHTERALIICPYVTPNLFLFPHSSIINPQDFRHEYEKKLTFNPFKNLARVIDRYLYSSLLKNSFVIVDSDHNRQDLYKFYPYVNECAVIPSLPDLEEIDRIWKEYEIVYIRIKDKYDIHQKYLYYPSHLIPYNNHLNLLEAIYLIEQKYKTKIYVLLSGGNDTLKVSILKKVEKYNLEVRYLGYLLYPEVLTLLLKAKALIFPSFIGPSISIWEAFYLGVPVCCSNIYAFQEQVGDAGLLFDPFNVEDMAEKIYRIWIDENMRKELVKRGYDRIKNLTLENYAKQWERVIEETLDMAERR